MTEDRLRERIRHGLVPLLDETPDGPGWDELEKASREPRSMRLVVAAVGIGAALIALVVSMVFIGDGRQPDPAGETVPFDVAEAVEMGRAWWSAVIEGDLGTAMSIAHPDGNFNYAGLRQAIGGLGLDSIAIDRDRFGSEALPQLCFSITGPGTGLNGSLVFRESRGSWLLWEIRSNVEGCEARTGITTTTVVSAEVTRLPLDVRAPIRVLAVRPNNPSLVVLDFESGTRTSYPPGSHALPLDAVDGAAATPGGGMIIWTQGVARLFDDDFTTVVSILGPHTLREIEGIAPAVRVVPALDGGFAWVVQPGIGYGDRDYPTLVELVELPSGQLINSFELDPNTFPIGATAFGLVLNLEGLVNTGDGWASDGSTRVVHLNLDGSVTELGAGRAIAATNDGVVKLVADRTRLVVVALDGHEMEIAQPAPAGTWIAVGGPGIPSDAMPLQTVSPDQTHLLVAIGEDLDVNGTPAQWTLFAVDLDSGDATAVRQSFGRPGLATWSRDGEWILAASIDGFTIELLSFDDPSEVETLLGGAPEGHFVLAAG